MSRTINAAEPAFLTPAIAPPVDALAEVRRLWREDPQAVEWALAKLTADGSWEGRWPGQMYGRYYEELSGRAGPILYFLHRSEAPRWDWALFAIKKPITAPEEQVLFWHGCLALWAAIATQTDSGGAAVEEAFPPWLSMAYGVIGRVYPLLTPAHQAALRASATPYLIAALGLHE